MSKQRVVVTRDKSPYLYIVTYLGMRPRPLAGLAKWVASVDRDEDCRGKFYDKAICAYGGAHKTEIYSPAIRVRPTARVRS